MKVPQRHIERNTDRNPSSFEVQVLENCAHSSGVLEALAEVLKYIDTPRCLMCLSDIFFRNNPFMSFTVQMTSTQIYLGVAEAGDPYELTQGGVVRCRNQEVVTVIERPQPASGNELRWSGIALFNRELVKELDMFLKEAPDDSPLGDFFEFCRKRGHPLQAVIGPDFVSAKKMQILGSMFPTKT